MVSVTPGVFLFEVVGGLTAPMKTQGGKGDKVLAGWEVSLPLPGFGTG